jgi:uncharacterized LabA/DUF88 family protein
MPQPTTYIFIDSANIIYGAKASGEWKVDLKKLFSYLQNKYQTKKIFYYAGFKNKSPKDKEKLDKLIKIGYTLKVKPLKFIPQPPEIKNNLCPKCKYRWTNTTSKPPTVKANCDVDLTLDVVAKMDKFEKAVILSGDGDFLPLYKFLEINNKTVSIISESSITARVIRQHFGARFSDLLSIRRFIEQK